MLRRSSRRLKAPAAESTVVSAEPSDSEVDCGDDFQEPIKRRKAQKKKARFGDQKQDLTKRKPRGRKGSLKELVNVPLDILFEILGNLNPVDLLHLARTTKDLRAILMNRSSLWIWKRARGNVKDLPNCPEDLTEPQYANLAFDPLCHYCHEANTPTIIWTNRTRCCGKCLDANFSGCLYSFREDLCKIVPTVNVRGTGSGRHRIRTKFCVRTWEQYSTELAILDSEERKIWLMKKCARYEVIATHAKLCERWNVGRLLDRSTELSTIRLRRYNEIERRFTELGWGGEFKEGPLRSIQNHALVKQPRDLTDRTWEKIMPELLKVLGDIRVERLERERLAAVDSRIRLLGDFRAEFVASQPLHSIIPDIGDLIRMEEFRAVIIDTPQNEIVSATHFSHAMGELPSLIKDWRRSKDSELLAIMKKSSVIGNDVTESILHLASTLFTCNMCYNNPIGYPQVLIHSCFYGPYQSHQAPHFVPCASWGTQHISLRPLTYMSAKSTLESCGFNPDTTSTQEISDANPLIECLDCSNDKSGRLLMRYRNAVAHSSGHINQGHRKVLADINSDHTEHLITKEKAWRKNASTCYSTPWTCVLCKAQLRSYNFGQHLLSVHQIEEGNALEDGHIVLSLDAPLSVAGYEERVILPGEPAVFDHE